MYLTLLQSRLSRLSLSNENYHETRYNGQNWWAREEKTEFLAEAAEPGPNLFSNMMMRMSYYSFSQIQPFDRWAQARKLVTTWSRMVPLHMAPITWHRSHSTVPTKNVRDF